jgi:hypothetical protein
VRRLRNKEEEIHSIIRILIYSGTNMMIPLDFPMDGALRLFPGGFLGFSAYEHRIGARPQNPAVALLGRDSGIMDVRTSLRELLDDAIMIFSCGVRRHVEKVKDNLSNAQLGTTFLWDKRRYFT